MRKKKTAIVIVILLAVCLTFYTRERKLLIDEDTAVTVEWNGQAIPLSADEERMLKDLISSMSIRRSFRGVYGPYHNESTIFIRLHDTEEDGVRGWLNLCLDEDSKSDFQGNNPEGAFYIRDEDRDKITAFLMPLLGERRAGVPAEKGQKGFQFVTCS